MSVVTIHQPEHLSYLGFFEKISRSEILVLLDCVNFEKNYFQNRNRIYTNNGVEFITVPVESGIRPISETRIHSQTWSSLRRKNLVKIEHAYKRAPFFEMYYPGFRRAYMLETESLSGLNQALLGFALDSLGIEAKIVFASSMKVTGNKSELLANICKEMGATVYLAGASGRDYLEMSHFTGIKVDIQSFRHPVYTQYARTRFEPFLSVLDALFNVGPDTMRIVKAAQ